MPMYSVSGNSRERENPMKKDQPSARTSPQSIEKGRDYQGPEDDAPFSSSPGFGSQVDYEGRKRSRRTSRPPLHQDLPCASYAI